MQFFLLTDTIISQKKIKQIFRCCNCIVMQIGNSFDNYFTPAQAHLLAPVRDYLLHRTFVLGLSMKICIKEEIFLYSQ
jgi:hypothetical protein